MHQIRFNLLKTRDIVNNPQRSTKKISIRWLVRRRVLCGFHLNLISWGQEERTEMQTSEVKADMRK